MMVRVKRVYETPSADDGYRVLVDRLWPRGLRSENAAVDQWAKEIAPSHELRKWFSHDPALWGEFQQRFLLELESRAEALKILGELQRIATRQRVTLLYAAATTTTNHALVIMGALNKLGQDRSSKA